MLFFPSCLPILKNLAVIHILTCYAPTWLTVMTQFSVLFYLSVDNQTRKIKK